METMWRWFFRFAVGVGVLFALTSFLFVIGMNRAHVTQSNGFTNVTPEAENTTLSQTLPKTASEIQYCRASVGMGGRLLLYRFPVPVSDLHDHAKAEFAAHWDKPKLKVVPNTTSPFTGEEIALHKTGFGIDVTWMLPPSSDIGTVYASDDGRSSHRPIIFVDETNSVLYFQMTD